MNMLKFGEKTGQLTGRAVFSVAAWPNRKYAQSVFKINIHDDTKGK